MSDHIRLEVNAPFGELILNRPHKRNALSIAMWEQIPPLIARCEELSDVHLVLIHGADTGHFAAGADISEFSEIYATRNDAHRSGKVIADALMSVETCLKPVLAAIDGSCVGGGVSLALAADIRISSAVARFAITPAKLGLVYPPGDTRRLIAATGLSRAKDLLFTGRIFPATDALSYGLIDFMCPEDHTPLAFTKAYAMSLLATSQWSIRAIKQMIGGVLNGMPDDHPDSVGLFLDGFESQDFTEGKAAFLEKRPAKFT